MGHGKSSKAKKAMQKTYRFPAVPEAEHASAITSQAKADEPLGTPLVHIHGHGVHLGVEQAVDFLHLQGLLLHRWRHLQPCSSNMHVMNHTSSAS